MKRLICLLLALTMLVSLSACGQSKEEKALSLAREIYEELKLGLVLKIGNVPKGEGFFRQTRRFFAGILCVFQEKATPYGGKRPVIWACWQF